MSGTRKMDKFELDAYTRESGPGDARAPEDVVDLPASTFAPRREGAAEQADLPALPFSPRVPVVEAAALDARASDPGPASGPGPTASADWVPNEWIPPQEPPDAD